MNQNVAWRQPARSPRYLPPNVSSNAFWLWTLRYLLVQDFDLDDDGRPETLRLLAATRRHWLCNGRTIRLRQMPTAFGPTSIHVTSRLSHGEVLAEVTLPPHPPRQTLLRLRLPEAWRPVQATDEKGLLSMVKDGTVDLTGKRGMCHIRLDVDEWPRR